MEHISIARYLIAAVLVVGAWGSAVAANEARESWAESFVREPAQQPYGTVAVFEDLYGNLWDLVQMHPRAHH